MSRTTLAQGLRALRALLFAAVAAAALPAAAFHFPWDQGHDTTNSNDPPPPGPDDRPPCDPDCGSGNATRSPVYASLGQAVWRDTDVALPGRPFLGVYRVYNSNDPVVGLFGNGWSVDFDIALYPGNASGVQQRIYKAPNGKRLVFVRQGDGSYVAPASRFDTVVETGTTVTMTSPDGRRQVFALDGRLLQRVDPNGNAVTLSYDGSGRPTRLADGNGRSLNLVYNGASLVSTVTDHGGRTWSYGYDANANLVSVTDPSGGVRRYAWQAYRPSGDANTYHQLLSVTDASGVVAVSFAYSGNQVASYTEGANRYTYTRTGSNTKTAGTVTRRDAMGVATSFSYGALGLVTQDVDGVGGRTSYTYDANGRVLATVDALNRTWASTYDTLGRLTSATNPLGQTSTVGFAGADPRPTRLVSPSGRTMSFTYDVRGNLVVVTDAGSATTRMTYNAAGDLVTVVDALGRSTSVAYNAIGLPVQLTDALGRSATKSYDALGRLVRSTNAAGESSSYAHDALDRLLRVTDPLGHTTSFAYDAAGRLVSVTDALGSVTRYDYDAFGRRSAAVAPDGRRTTYAYRADNLLQTITWPDGSTISYGYDNNKRLTSESAGGQTNTFSYNAVGQMTAATGPGGAVSFTYDSAGRIASETNAGRTLAVVRNADGERTTLNHLGHTVTYTRDARGQVAQIAHAAFGTFTFGLDALGRRTELRYPNGAATTYAYDAAGQMTQLAHSGAFSAVYAYTHDAAGRVTRTAGDGPDWNFAYDLSGRLVSGNQGPTTFAYTPDAVGNLLDNGRTHDVNHRLTADAVNDYSYDARGNLLQERDRSTGRRVVYGWNVRNQLTQVQFFADGTATNAVRTLSYSYDPLGRRATKTDNGVLQRFVYDGRFPVGVLDAAGTVVSLHAFGLSPDEPLAVSAGGAVRWLHADRLGSVRTSVDGAGTVRAVRYGPYGEELDGTAPDTAFGFGGKERDAPGLYFHRARYYAAEQRRFVSLDPVGLAGGMNPYRFADADPVNFGDPDGTNVGIAIGIGVRVIGGRAAAAAIGAAARRALGPIAGGIAACVLAGVCSTSEEAENPEAPGDEAPPIPDQPQQCPGPGWEWRGKPPVGGDKGAWHNPGTGESLHPDLDHPEPIGPHWDYTDRNGDRWRIFPDGRKEPK